MDVHLQYQNFAGDENLVAQYTVQADAAFFHHDNRSVIQNLGRLITLNQFPSEVQLQRLDQAYKHVYGGLKNQWDGLKDTEKTGMTEDVRSQAWMGIAVVEDEILGLCRALCRLLQQFLLRHGTTLDVHLRVELLLILGRVSGDLLAVVESLTRDAHTTAYYLAADSNPDLSDALTRKAAMAFAQNLLQRGDKTRAERLFNEIADANPTGDIAEVEQGLEECGIMDLEFKERLAKAIVILGAAKQSVRDATDAANIAQVQVNTVWNDRIEEQQVRDVLGSLFWIY